MLSEEAKAKKSAYNLKRNKELTKLFAARLPINEYNEICDYLRSQGINKAEFIRWAYNKLKNKESN